jgi:hypothetical protein
MIDGNIFFQHAGGGGYPMTAIAEYIFDTNDYTMQRCQRLPSLPGTI